MPSYTISSQGASVTPVPATKTCTFDPIRVYVGDDWPVPLALVDDNGNPIDLTGATVGVNFWVSGNAGPVDLAAAGGGLQITSLLPGEVLLLVPRVVTASVPYQPDAQIDFSTRAQCYLIDTLGHKQTFEVIPFQPLAPRGMSIPASAIGSRRVVLRTQGPAGAPGPAGPPGPAGGVSFSFVQAQPSSIWTIAHNLGRYPSVTLVDTAGDQFSADVSYIDASTVVVSLGFPTAGVAYLN